MALRPSVLRVHRLAATDGLFTGLANAAIPPADSRHGAGIGARRPRQQPDPACNCTVCCLPTTCPCPACACRTAATARRRSRTSPSWRPGQARNPRSAGSTYHGAPVPQRGGFRLRWSLQDTNIVTTAADCEEGVCNHCHDPVWQADAAEFYFSFDLGDTRQNVTEVDISALPGGLWGGWINNTFGYDGSSPNILIDCSKAAQVAHTRVAGGWGANLTIPWSIYTHGRASPAPDVSTLPLGPRSAGRRYEPERVVRHAVRRTCAATHRAQVLGVARRD